MKLGAVILAAGQSRRMGAPKMTLPWGNTTVIGQVVGVLAQAGVADLIVVTGGTHGQVEAALNGMPARCVYNPRYVEDEMVLSLQTGLAALDTLDQATLVALGDQPQIEIGVVQAVVAAYRHNSAALVVPSYQFHRGHPWLVARSLWTEVQALHPGQTLREFLNTHTHLIEYVPVETSSILRDLDTPEDYRRDYPPPVSG